MSEVGSCACCKNFRLLKQCTKPGCLSTLCHSKSNSLPCIRELSMDPFFCPPCTLRLNCALTVKLLYPRFWKMPDKDSIQMHARRCLSQRKTIPPANGLSWNSIWPSWTVLSFQPSSQPAESYVRSWAWPSDCSCYLFCWVYLSPHIVCIYQGSTPGRKWVSAEDSRSA